MNIKKTTQNGLIGLTAIVASSCAITKTEGEQKVILNNTTYTIETNESGYVVKSSGNGITEPIEIMKDYNGDNVLDEYVSIYAKDGIYKVSAANIPASLNSKYQKILDKYSHK